MVFVTKLWFGNLHVLCHFKLFKPDKWINCPISQQLIFTMTDACLPEKLTTNNGQPCNTQSY